jgi:hypothetical protein
MPAHTSNPPLNEVPGVPPWNIGAAVGGLPVNSCCVIL